MGMTLMPDEKVEEIWKRICEERPEAATMSIDVHHIQRLRYPISSALFSILLLPIALSIIVLGVVLGVVLGLFCWRRRK